MESWNVISSFEFSLFRYFFCSIHYNKILKTRHIKKIYLIWEIVYNLQHLSLETENKGHTGKEFVDAIQGKSDIIKRKMNQ